MDSLSFMPVQSLDLEAEKSIPFDLFLDLPLNQKVILYRRKGGQVDAVFLDKIGVGAHPQFMVRGEDYPAYVKYVARRLDSLIDDSNTERSRELRTTAVKAILSSTLNAKSSDRAESLMANLGAITNSLLESSLDGASPIRQKAFEKLVQLAEQGSDFHRHPVNVTSLSVLIAYGIGYSTRKVLSDVAVGALLHDVGLATLEADIRSRAHEPMQLTHDQRQRLEQHGERALSLLQEKNIPINEIIRSIIMQHHEQFNGSGYPLGLRGWVINEFAQIVHVADEIDHLFHVDFQDAEYLRRSLAQLFLKLISEKRIEPGLASRIRRLFLKTELRSSN